MKASAVTPKPKAPVPPVTAAQCPTCGGSGTVEDDAAVGQRLRKARKMARLTMKEVGRRMGFTESYLSDLECGKRWFSPILQRRYEEALRAGNGEAGMGAPAAGFKEAGR